MIAICVTTFLRDDLLYETIKSIVSYRPKDCMILIGDQNPTNEKHQYFYNIPDCYYFPLEYNCGLSAARNQLVWQANQLGSEYCVISADSIQFTESMRQLSKLTQFMYWSPEIKYDIIGMDLKNRKFGWEGWLDLIPNSTFQIDFIDKTIKADINMSIYCIYNCEIIRNFFIARTDALLEVKWDDNLIMAEHEDFFWRIKLAGKKVGWTNICSGNYVGEASKQDGDYATLRRKNWNEGQKRLKAKYGLKGWVKYINLERAKDERN